VDPSGPPDRAICICSLRPDWKTWVYISADPLTFFRGAVEIDTIKGDNVYLSDGPPTGTKVLAAGSAASLRDRVKVGH